MQDYQLLVAICEMRKLLYFLVGLMIITSCEKEIPEVGFRIKSSGFFLEDGNLFPAANIPSFSHKLAGGIVSFTSDQSSFEFRTGRISIEDFQFELPPGKYQMEFRIAEASLYGQKGGSFQAEPTSITVSEGMQPEVPVSVVANCALFLVNDELDELDKGIYMIERFASGEGYYSSYPLTLDTITSLYYAYFTPDSLPSNPSAYLWFYGRKPGNPSGGLPTLDFEKGYQYLIEVLE